MGTGIACFADLARRCPKPNRESRAIYQVIYLK
jgi:hypothetical protein